MKKLFIAAIAVFGFTTANAQFTPEKGDFITEVQFNPFADNFNTFKLNGGAFKVRYFVSDKDVIRAKVRFGIDNDKDKTVTSLNDNFTSNLPTYNLQNQTVETTNKQTNFDITIGYERHLLKEGRFDVYAGAEVGFGFESRSGEIKTTISNDDYNVTTANVRTQFESTKTEKFEKQNTGSTPSTKYLAAAIFAGMDFYIYKGLYVGTELGIYFKSAKNRNNPFKTTTYSETVTTTPSGGSATVTSQEWTESTETGIKTGSQTTGGTTTPIETAATTTNREFSGTSIKFDIEPAIRFGWRF